MSFADVISAARHATEMRIENAKINAYYVGILFTPPDKRPKELTTRKTKQSAGNGINELFRANLGGITKK